MNERLLQFIWQHQHFNQNHLVTEQGERLEIIDKGSYNSNQGPDFIGGKVRLLDTTWAGNIELHVLASDWNRHHHTTDPNYNNIILHVVWRNDLAAGAAGDRNLPTLELESRVPKWLLGRYEEMMNFRQFIPCENYLPYVHNGLWKIWKKELLNQRLTRKAAHINKLLQENNYHWEETFWWMIARNFGGKINGEAFEMIARSIPLNVLARHKDQLVQLEAILFGQASLLSNKFSEHYPVMLQKEYRFLQKKYQLRRNFVSLKFLRMRPVAFPTVRLALLASLIHESNHLFSKTCEMDVLQDVRLLFNITANDYWHYHYRFDEPSDFQKKNLGKDMTENLVINTVVPTVYAFGLHRNDANLIKKSINWLSEIAAEKNNILKCWEKHAVVTCNAIDSQALIGLKTSYCDVRRCLECRIGENLLGMDKSRNTF